MEAEGPNSVQEHRFLKRGLGFAPVTAIVVAVATPARRSSVCVALLFVGALVLVYSPLLNTLITWPSFTSFSSSKPPPPFMSPPQPKPNYVFANSDVESSPTCPEYFRWIHEDLRTWRETGVTKETVEKVSGKVHFRFLVVDGRVYVERYVKSFQTRDVFTIWGILQLLRRYPGRVPDLDLMFNCNDHPFVGKSQYYVTKDPASSVPPPVFSYCANAATLDLVFPDWSFWGWPEINIKPWKQLLKELTEGNKKMKWEDREPYAYWKGNPSVSPRRQSLLRHCSVSKERDWNARLFSMDWDREIRRSFTDSNLADQCKHRYKIYIEGRAWSVSDKHILACDSLALFITQKYYDFFSRGLVPMQHYWPIQADDMCRSIKFAVDWGNSHQQQARAMGKEGSDFVREKLKLDYVYDYMFHLLNEYSKLLKYKPVVPSKAVLFCLESMASDMKNGLTESFLINSTVEIQPSSNQPCRLPPPFTDGEKRALLAKKGNLTRQVELLERNVDEVGKEKKKKY